MRNQGVQTIETGAFNFNVLPPITEPLKKDQSKIIVKNKQTKLKISSLIERQSILNKYQQAMLQKKNTKKIVLQPLNLPLIKPELTNIQSKSKDTNISSQRLLDNLQLVSCISRIRNLSYNEPSIERVQPLTIRGTQSQIQSRIFT